MTTAERHSSLYGLLDLEADGRAAPAVGLFSRSLRLEPAEVSTLGTSPRVIVPGHGPNTVVLPLMLQLAMRFVSTPYEDGTTLALRWQFDTALDEAYVPILYGGLGLDKDYVNSVWSGGASTDDMNFPGFPEDEPLVVAAYRTDSLGEIADPVGGDSPIVVTAYYSVAYLP